MLESVQGLRKDPTVHGCHDMLHIAVLSNLRTVLCHCSSQSDVAQRAINAASPSGGRIRLARLREDLRRRVSSTHAKSVKSLEEEEPMVTSMRSSIISVRLLGTRDDRSEEMPSPRDLIPNVDLFTPDYALLWLQAHDSRVRSFVRTKINTADS